MTKPKKPSIVIQEKAADVTHETTKVIAALVPFGIGSAIHSALVPSPAEKRMLRMIEQLRQDFQRLQEAHPQLTTETLENNEALITARYNVLSISVREHREEKLTALRNIVLNIALPNDAHEDMQLMFIQLVDSFTTWHIKLLSFFDDDKWWEHLGYSDGLSELDPKLIAHAIFRQMSELGDEIFLYKVINDLSKNQLIDFPELGGEWMDIVLVDDDASKITKPIMTSLGKKFIASIKSPLNPKSAD